MIKKLAICDWGIGGIGVLKMLRENHGVNSDIIYLSDAGFVPYGKVPEKELTSRWHEVKNFLLSQGADHIIVACNALSTVVTNEENVTTIVEIGKRIVAEKSDIELGIIGGVITINSGIYRTNSKRHQFNIAQPLSALVERGELSGEEVRQQIENIIAPIRESKEILLACTHYPALLPIFTELYPNIDWIDPAPTLSRVILDNFDLTHGNRDHQFYTTGSTIEMQESAFKAFSFTMKEADLRELSLSLSDNISK
ncbi:MAG: aspartate/glutamate racemase family protein [Flavobacteriales bacterium]|nr:aspartate/glutamate racemase family protein [Flavobacteriales bacterium]